MIPDYEDWKEIAKSIFLETHAETGCPECNGSGETECCECGHEKECEDCDDGVVYRNLETDRTVKMPGFTPQDYYKAMVNELRLIAKWQGKPTLRLVLPVARSIRKKFPLAVRLRKHKYLTRNSGKRQAA